CHRCDEGEAIGTCCWRASHSYTLRVHRSTGLASIGPTSDAASICRLTLGSTSATGSNRRAVRQKRKPAQPCPPASQNVGKRKSLRSPRLPPPPFLPRTLATNSPGGRIPDATSPLLTGQPKAAPGSFWRTQAGSEMLLPNA